MANDGGDGVPTNRTNHRGTWFKVREPGWPADDGEGVLFVPLEGVYSMKVVCFLGGYLFSVACHQDHATHKHD